MSVSKPSESSPVKGNGGSNMRLTLNSAGDHNGNAFQVSTSSSSSSSSYMGESSPESMQSLSSLSGGRIDSPLDYDMLEVTLMTTVVTEIKVTDVISKWTMDEDRKQIDDDASVQKRTTEMSESNDNSVSVYLDATGDHHPDTWNDNDMTQALSLKTNGSGHNKDDEISYRDVSRRSSTIPDSDATEIPLDECDDNDDEEEALFLSLSSDMDVQQNSTSQFKDCFMNPGESADKGEAVTCLLDIPLDSKTEPDASEDNFKPTQKSLSCCSSPKPEHNYKKDPSFPPDECAVGSRSHSCPVKSTKNKKINDTTTTKRPGIKLSTVEAERVTVVDLKNVRAKVGSRNAKANIGSPSKSPSPRYKSSATIGKKVFPRKEDKQSGEGEKQQRSFSGPVKVAVVLKPIKGKSYNLKTHHKTAASHSPQPVVSRTLSTSTSSLGSEMVEDATRKPVQDDLDKHGTTKSVETTHPSGDVGKQCVENKNEAVIADAHEKPKSHSRKVSSKLGPNARQHGKGIRLDKVFGSATPSGHGSPGPRQVQRDVSVLGEGAWSGSPTRARQSQSQSQHGQGIPKPRTTTERAATLTDLASTTPISKPTASQHSALALSGRQAIPSASKLPVKGLPPSLSSSSLGSNENAGATSKTPAGVSTPMGTKSDQWPSRSTVPGVSQSPTKPPISSTATTMSSSDKGTSANIGVTAAPKPPAVRSRALSLQARTTTTGLKGPAAASHNTAKMAVASQGVVKQTYPLQRSGSVRLTRLNSTVDKNKPRETQTRQTNTNSSSHIAASAGGTNHNQQQPPPDLVADVVNSNAPVTQVLPVPVTESTNTGSGTTAAPGHGFKARTGLRSSPKTGPRIRSASKPVVAGLASGTLEAKHNKEQAEKKNQAINQLKKLLVQGNRRVEALATVIQHLFTEREEALKQKKELSLELERLRAELVTSSQSYERLQKEKEEVRISFEEALKRQEEQHKEELVQLEDRLRSFYQTEWDKVHQTYQEEADKCRMLMEQQVEELRNRQIAERKNQELSHSQTVETLKQQYEASIQELKSIQQTDLESLEKILKETESALSEKICELSAEKEALNEKLQAEEERRKRILTDKNLKDSHTLYLEQELESLKVVLEIKNNQLHQKEKKLMEMDKLMETNVKLEECLKKVQQENEDYKARMDKHAALSKQLSTEQAILQQTLQKESKVNKRLSMENEELLWKLNNGDLLASPRHLSPSSPFSSPRNSASFSTSAPLSPR